MSVLESTGIPKQVRIMLRRCALLIFPPHTLMRVLASRLPLLQEVHLREEDSDGEDCTPTGHYPGTPPPLPLVLGDSDCRAPHTNARIVFCAQEAAVSIFFLETVLRN